MKREPLLPEFDHPHVQTLNHLMDNAGRVILWHHLVQKHRQTQQEGRIMADGDSIDERIEELRRKLYLVVGPGYSPERIQAAGGVAEELDRLVVEKLRSDLARQAASAAPHPKRRRRSRPPQPGT